MSGLLYRSFDDSVMLMTKTHIHSDPQPCILSLTSQDSRRDQKSHIPSQEEPGQAVHSNSMKLERVPLRTEAGLSFPLHRAIEISLNSEGRLTSVSVGFRFCCFFWEWQIWLISLLLSWLHKHPTSKSTLTSLLTSPVGGTCFFPAPPRHAGSKFPCLVLEEDFLPIAG